MHYFQEIYNLIWPDAKPDEWEEAYNLIWNFDGPTDSKTTAQLKRLAKEWGEAVRANRGKSPEEILSEDWGEPPSLKGKKVTKHRRRHS